MSCTSLVKAGRLINCFKCPIYWYKSNIVSHAPLVLPKTLDWRLVAGVPLPVRGPSEMYKTRFNVLDGSRYIKRQVMSSVLKMDTRGDFVGVCRRGSRLPVSTILLAGPSAFGTGLSLISGAVGGKKRFEFEDFWTHRKWGNRDDNSPPILVTSAQYATSRALTSAKEATGCTVVLRK